VKKGKWPFLFIGIILILGACAQNEPKNQTSPVKKQVEKVKLPSVDHIVIVIEENHSRSQIAAHPSAPYMNLLMKEGANFTNYHAIEHPSQPNYLDLFSGSNQGVTNDRVPASKFSSANLASELIEKHYSFAGYSEGLPSTGFNGESAGRSGYARKHNPWVNFTNIPKEANQPLTNFPKDFKELPTVSFVIPSLQNDMHDGTIKEADQWLKAHLDSYVQWAKKHNSLLIVTWDEDEGSQNNTIPTFFVGPMVKAGQYSENFNHFNLLRTIEDIYGLTNSCASMNISHIAWICR
jgi:hypothetical protein